MPDHPGFTAETLLRMARESVAQPLSEADAAAVAGLLAYLAADMRAFHKLPLGEVDPSTIYNSAADTKDGDHA